MIDADFKKMESRELLLDNPIAYLLSRENHVFCSEIGIPMALNGITPVYDFYLLKPDEYKLIHYNECDYIVIANRGNDTYFAVRKNEDMVYFFNIEDDIDRIWEVNSNIEKFIRTLI